MNKSVNNYSELTNQKRFEEEANYFRSLMDELSRTEKGGSTLATTKHTYADLCTDYDTYLNVQKCHIEFSEFLLQWASQPNSADTTYKGLSRNKIPNFAEFYGELTRFVRLISEAKQASYTSGVGEYEQLKILSSNKASIKKVISENSFLGYSNLAHLEPKILVLGFLRYYVNEEKKLPEKDFHHLVNNEGKDGVKTFRKIFDNTPISEKDFVHLVETCCCIDNLALNPSTSNLKFLKKLQNQGLSFYSIMSKFHELLASHYLVERSSDCSQYQIWQKFKDEILERSKVNNKSVYLTLKDIHPDDLVDLSPIDEGEPLSEVNALCERLNIRVVKKNAETENDRTEEEGDETVEKIELQNNQAYLIRLHELAASAESFESFLENVSNEINDTFTIKTKPDPKNNNPATMPPDSFIKQPRLSFRLKSIKRDIIQGILKLGGEQTVELDSATQITNAYFHYKDQKRSPCLSLYLKYVDQQYGEGLHRYNGKLFPSKADLKIFINEVNEPLTSSSAHIEDLILYLRKETSMSERIIEIYQYLTEKQSTHKIGKLISSFAEHYQYSIQSLLELIDEEIERPRLSKNKKGKSEQVSSFDYFISYTEQHNPLKEKGVGYKELYRINLLLRVLVNIAIYIDEEDKSIQFLVRISAEEELECLSRIAILEHFFVEELKEEDKQKVVTKYLEYRHEQTQLAKLYVLCVLCLSSSDDCSESIEQLVSKYYTTKNTYNSLEEFFEKEFTGKNTSGRFIKAFPEHLKSKVAEVFSFKKAILKNDTNDSKSHVVLTDQIKSKLTDNQWDVAEIENTFENGRILEKVWDELIPCPDHLLLTTIISRWFDNSSQTFTNRGNIKSKLTTGILLTEMLNKISNLGFDGWLIPYTQNHKEILENKLLALGNIQYFGDEHFEIEQSLDANNKLGQGSFGCVYLAKDLALDATVAIKLIPTWGDNPESHERIAKKLRNEASIMRHCQHENVLTVYGIHKFKTANFTYLDDTTVEQQKSLNENYVYGIVMEYVADARTLADFVKSSEFAKYSNKQKLDLFIQICKGVEQAHNLNTPIIHGDIKPSNILIAPDGTPKLIDFGISSKAGSVLGASSGEIFSSPNVINGGEASVQDDIHSLGMIILFLLYNGIINELIQSTTSHHSERLKLFFKLLGTNYYSYFSVDKAITRKNLKQQYNQVKHFKWSEFEELIFNNVSIPKSSFWDFDWGLLFTTLSKSLNSVSLNCNLEANLTEEGDTYSQVANLRRSLKRFLTSDGLVDAFDSVKLRTVAIYDGEILERENIANFPVIDIYGDAQKQTLCMKWFESLKTICKVDNFKKDCFTFIAFEQNHNFSNPFIYHLPTNCFVGKNSTTNFIRDFYQPNKLLLEQLSSFEPSQFIEQFLSLINTLPQEYTPIKKVSYNPELVSIADTFSLSSVNRSLLFDAIEKICGELLKGFRQESSAVTVIEMINEANLNGLGELKYTTKEEILNEFKLSSNLTEFLKADDEFESIFGWRGSFNQAELKLISEVLFFGSEFDKTLLTKFLGLKPRLTNAGLLAYMLKGIFPPNFVEYAQVSIKKLMKCEEHEVAKADITRIEEYMSEKLTEHHIYLQCSDPYISAVSYCNSYPEHRMPFIILSDIDS